MINSLKLFLAFVASWLVPGLGYLLLNKKMKFFLLFGSVMLLTIVGIVIADFRDIRFIDNPYYYIGRFGGGMVWGMLMVILKFVPAGVVGVQYFDIGHLYICVAGTLNLVIALSVFSQAEMDKKRKSCKTPVIEAPGLQVTTTDTTQTDIPLST